MDASIRRLINKVGIDSVMDIFFQLMLMTSVLVAIDWVKEDFFISFEPRVLFWGSIALFTLAGYYKFYEHGHNKKGRILTVLAILVALVPPVYALGWDVLKYGLVFLLVHWANARRAKEAHTN